MKKILVLLITFLVIGLVSVSAQNTAQLERELQEITMRGLNRGGTLTAQETQRATEIAIQIFVAQGIPRSQAQAMAPAFVAQLMTDGSGNDSGYPSNITPEQQRQFEELQQAEQRAQQWQETPDDRRRQQLMDDYLEGRITMAEYNRRTSEIDGWPTTQAMARFGNKVTRPAGNYDFTYVYASEELRITIGKPNGQNITQAEARTLYNHFLAFGDVHRVYTGYRPPVESFINDGVATILYQDPQRPTTAGVRNMIQIEVRYQRNGWPHLTVVMTPTSLPGDGTQ